MDRSRGGRVDASMERYSALESARLGQKKWFVALLVVNTLAILDILYVFVFSKRKVTPENKATGSGISMQ